MSQKIINVGTVANDGTGDTIRGAFTNVNANFTEVYANISTLTAGLASIDNGQNTAISAAYNTANAAFLQANTGNTMAYNLSVSANGYADIVGAAGNAYAVTIGTSGNAYADVVGSSANAYSTLVGSSANSYSAALAAAGNSYAVQVGAAANAVAADLVSSVNSYVSVLAANNAVGANGWANTVSVNITDWANAKFETVSTGVVFNTTNAAFAKANTALQNASGTLIGSLLVTGYISDGIGSLREKFANTTTSNLNIQTTGSIIIANNSDQIYVNVLDDNNFLVTPNVGTSVEIYQYGAGPTTIRPNSGAVTILSSNNWANIAGQYLSASIVKVKANTWILSGNLRA